MNKCDVNNATQAASRIIAGMDGRDRERFVYMSGIHKVNVDKAPFKELIKQILEIQEEIRNELSQ